MDKKTKELIESYCTRVMHPRQNLLKILDLDLDAELELNSFNKLLHSKLASIAEDEGSRTLVSVLSQTVINAKVLEQQVQKTLNNSLRLTLEKIAEEDQLSAAKSIRMYKEWGHKLARWVGGTVVVVILYSGTVYMANCFDWIKVPVKDTFFSQNK